MTDTLPAASADYRVGFTEGQRTAATDPALAQRIAAVVHMHHPAARAQGYRDAVAQTVGEPR